jgi:glycosyltransferase involved in cell wall biosynthesis/cytochrome c-type biogenesis protein CcmH/NrfG
MGVYEFVPSRPPRTTHRSRSKGQAEGAKSASAVALAFEAAGAHHNAALLWTDVARSNDPNLLRRHRVLRRLAKATLARGDHAAAIPLLERHLAIVPGDRDAADSLLKARLGLALLHEREAVYQEHAARFGETASTLIARAVELERFRARDRALAALQGAEALCGDNPKLRLKLARAYQDSGRPDRALEILHSLPAAFQLRLDVEKAKLGALEASGAKRDVILKQAGRVAAADPDPVAARAMLGRIYRKYEDWSGSADAFETALELDRDRAEHWVGAVTAYGVLERDDRIDELLADARRAFAPARREGMLKLSKVALAGGEPDEAIGNARQALRDAVTKSRAREALATALVKSGRYLEGWQHLSAVLRDGTPGIDAVRHAARVASALRMAKPGRSGVPKFPDVLFERALLSPPEGRTLIQPRNVVLLATSSLGAGGAERQVALTAAGTARTRGGEAGTVLAGLDLAPDRGRSIMRPIAEAGAEDLVIEDLAKVSEGEVFRRYAAAEPATREALRLMASFPSGLAKDILKLYDCFRRHAPSVVHLWQDGVITTGSVAAVLAGVPRIICSVRNVVATESDRRRYRTYLETVYRCLAQRLDTRFTANSAAGARDYEQWLGLPEGEFQVLRNGVDVEGIRSRAPADAVRDIRAKLKLSPGALVVGGCFRLAPAKRPHLWLDAVGRLVATDPRVYGVIVGDGVMRQELQNTIDRNGFNGRIILAGRQSPVEPWMAAMDVLLLSSEVEGLPNVLLEAESLGVPVVTTEAGGSAEAILAGITGVLVKDDTPEELATAINRVVASEKLRRCARSGGPRFIEQRFGIHRMLRETLAVYGDTAHVRRMS